MSQRSSSKNQILFHASEIGQFHFCSISWYLQHCGYRPESPLLKKGIRSHDLVGKNLIQLDERKKKIGFLRRCAIGLILLALIGGVYEVVSSMF